MIRLVITMLFLFGANYLQAESPRVVSLSPSLTELVCELGFKYCLVGRSSACDYPKEVLALPVVGDFGRPNLEAVLKIHPDVVLFTDLEKPGVLEKLNDMNIKAMTLSCEGWDALLQAARTIATALGDPARGESWAKSAQERRERLLHRVDTFYQVRKRPKVYVEIWGDPLTTAGKGSFVNELVTWAGGIPLGGELQASYAQVSHEWILRQIRM